MTPAQKDEDPEAKGYSQGYEYFGMALNFTIAILLFGAGGWFLDGAKTVVLHGDSAQRLIVSARTSGERDDPDGITFFIVN